MFGDDSFFDEIERAFFGQPARQRKSSSGNVLHGEREERVIDYIEEEDGAYFVFELNGYSKDDIEVDVKGKDLEVNAIKERTEGVQDYLSNKLSKGLYFRKTIPSGVKAKKFDWTFRNGILEVKFKRK